MLNKTQIANLTKARHSILTALNKLYHETNKPLLKKLYQRIALNVLKVPINIKPGYYLYQDHGFTTEGTNVKRIVYKNNKPILQSAIYIPYKKLFSGNQINLDGFLTLLHEYSHVVLSPYERTFGHNLFGKINEEAIDEFFADLLMVKIAKKLKIPTYKIQEHMRKRYGIHPGVNLILDILRGKDMHKAIKYKYKPKFKKHKINPQPLFKMPAIHKLFPRPNESKNRLFRM